MKLSKTHTLYLFFGLSVLWSFVIHSSISNKIEEKKKATPPSERAAIDKVVDAKIGAYKPLSEALNPQMEILDVRKALKRIEPEDPINFFKNAEPLKSTNKFNKSFNGYFQGDLSEFDKSEKSLAKNRLLFRSEFKESKKNSLFGNVHYSVLTPDGDQLRDTFYEGSTLLRKSDSEENVYFMQINSQVFWQIVVHSDGQHLYLNQFEEGHLTATGRLVRIK